MKIPDLPNFDRRQLDELKRAAELQKQLPQIQKLREAAELAKKFSMPNISDLYKPLPMPKIEPIKIPTLRERNNYASSGVLLRALEQSYNQWKTTLGEDIQPVIYAFLSNGDSIQVTELIEQGFHGIEIRGFLHGLPCLLLQHQNSLQFLCVAEPVTPEKPKRRIGFYLQNRENKEPSVEE